MGLINNIPALVQIMAWRRSGEKPLSEPMVISALTHKCVTRPQWVKTRVQCDLSIFFLFYVVSKLNDAMLQGTDHKLSCCFIFCKIWRNALDRQSMSIHAHSYIKVNLYQRVMVEQRIVLIHMTALLNRNNSIGRDARKMHQSWSQPVR